GHATYKNIIGRTLQEIEFQDVDLVEVEKEVEALRKREEIERQREEEQQAQGDHEVAELKAIIDEENALVQDEMRKPTTPNFSREGHQKRPTASRTTVAASPCSTWRVTCLRLPRSIHRQFNIHHTTIPATPGNQVLPQ
ncbi:MAG: hypothetical protein L6R42_010990, partial [Xanthoria sp. 1 TBL-2021]